MVLVGWCVLCRVRNSFCFLCHSHASEFWLLLRCAAGCRHHVSRTAQQQTEMYTAIHVRRARLPISKSDVYLLDVFFVRFTLHYFLCVFSFILLVALLELSFFAALFLPHSPYLPVFYLALLNDAEKHMQHRQWAMTKFEFQTISLLFTISIRIEFYMNARNTDKGIIENQERRTPKDAANGELKRVEWASNNAKNVCAHIEFNRCTHAMHKLKCMQSKRKNSQIIEMNCAIGVSGDGGE